MARKATYTKGLSGVDYTAQALQDYGRGNASAIAKEYQRLRKITQRRAERLQRSEFAYNAPALTSKSLSKKLKPSSELSTRQMATRISEMARFLDMRTSTIAGAREVRRENRERTEDALSWTETNEKGEEIKHKFHFDSMREFDLFTQFMDYIRAVYKDNFSYDIEDVRDVFNDYAYKVMNKSMSFDKFVDLYKTRYERKPEVLQRPTEFK